MIWNTTSLLLPGYMYIMPLCTSWQNGQCSWLKLPWSKHVPATAVNNDTRSHMTQGYARLKAGRGPSLCLWASEIQMAEGNPTTLDPLFRTHKKLVLFGMKPSDPGRPSKPETGASNDSITCQWCLIATGLQRNLLKTCILSMHAEMITKRLWDSISWDFLVQFLRVSRLLSLQPSSHHRPTSQYRANAAHVNPSGRWDPIQSD